jgi:hypothetical protein
MKTYVAEINGEAIMAFRAEDDVGALAFVNEENGDFQLGLHDVVRADGKPLRDGESAISPRLATAAEHDQWLKVRNAETGAAADGKQIDPEMGGDLDDFSVYLIPVIDSDDMRMMTGEKFICSAKTPSRKFGLPSMLRKGFCMATSISHLAATKRLPMTIRFLWHSNPSRMLPTTSPKRNDRKLMSIGAVPIGVRWPQFSAVADQKNEAQPT